MPQLTTGLQLFLHIGIGGKKGKAHFSFDFHENFPEQRRTRLWKGKRKASRNKSASEILFRRGQATFSRHQDLSYEIVNF